MADGNTLLNDKTLEMPIVLRMNLKFHGLYAGELLPRNQSAAAL
jgi:hypothetical protein